MKKLLAICVFSLITFTISAQSIKLPTPTKKGGMSLNEALVNRKSTRTFAPTKLTDQQLSNLLWTANGVNRQDGRRTAPSARNCQEIEIYVFMENGIFLYTPDENVLKEVAPEDHRAEVSLRGDFTAKAPVVLVFFANYDKMEGMDDDAREFYGATDCGYVSQNVYLYCAANKLNTVVLGAIQRDILRDFIGGPNDKVILAQPVGNPGK